MGQDRHRHARAQPRELGRVAGRDRLLGVLEVVGRQAVEEPLREPRRPGAVASIRSRGPSPTASRTARTRASSSAGAKPTLRYSVRNPRRPAPGPRPPSPPARRERGRRGSRSASARRLPTAGAAAGETPARRGPRARCRSRTAPTTRSGCRGARGRSRRTGAAADEVVVERVGTDHERRHRLDQHARGVGAAGPHHRRLADPDRAVVGEELDEDRLERARAVAATTPAGAVGTPLRHRDGRRAELGDPHGPVRKTRGGPGSTIAGRPRAGRRDGRRRPAPGRARGRRAGRRRPRGRARRAPSASPGPPPARLR